MNTIEEILEDYGIIFSTIDFKAQPGLTKEKILERIQKERVLYVPEPKQVTCISD